MNDENFNKWIAAIRSGDFIQGKTRLRMREGSFSGETGVVKHCCLGVGCEVAEIDFLEGDVLVPWGFIKWLGIPVRNDDIGRGEHYEFNIGVVDIATNDIKTLVSALNDGVGLGAPRGGKSLSFEEVADWLEKNRDDLVAI